MKCRLNWQLGLHFHARALNKSCQFHCHSGLPVPLIQVYHYAQIMLILEQYFSVLLRYLGGSEEALISYGGGGELCGF